MKCINRWRAGDRIVMRSVWDDKVQAAWPVTVVSDSPEALVLFLASGTNYKIRYFSGDMQGRMPIGEWRLVDREWTRDMIRIMLAGDNHAYLGFWDQHRRFERWYVNLEREYERTSTGIDFVDLFLDVVIDPDTKEWHWKDELELSCAVSLGLLSQEEANLIGLKVALLFGDSLRARHRSARAGRIGSRIPTGQYRLWAQSRTAKVSRANTFGI